jgi:hypothetical protein
MQAVNVITDSESARYRFRGPISIGSVYVAYSVYIRTNLPIDNGWAPGMDKTHYKTHAHNNGPFFEFFK